MNYARAALDGLSGGIPPISKFQGGFPWSQEGVNDRWAQMGQPAPAPLVPASMIGWSTGPGRAMGVLTKRGEKNRPFTKAERDFANYWAKVAADPYRKQSGISKAAGVILKVASVALPAFSIAEAASTAGNLAFQLPKAKSDAALENRVMTPALEAQATKDAADFSVQLDKLNALAPKLSPAQMAQANFAAAGARVNTPAREAEPAGLPVVLALFAAGAALLIVTRP